MPTPIQEQIDRVKEIMGISYNPTIKEDHHESSYMAKNTMHYYLYDLSRQ